ncbi:sigma-54-dependent Fis family transcriptional regulator [Glaciimonas sp. CA11.2]|uniref:sigma-54-dependent Fis family transcriptional regulator n=1 Tax=unclassified Glaciimonas TaxID=2644401 RepID=UPI002B2235A8|nr:MULTISPECIES: sigma-54-dependent Fis family transcriptional regulator [unclassified Glaciimonas]MEB0011652.1 sigma-54-dependent Fis family transcriptional regulator [Glaciimonas sp. Cout2]MEB0081449.1 sigma-54-dependent Fis family transcriptional regulator [Glaciimonas sp. Gout2]MEB0161455.1 sigma-54-dependent Fis family transcriptional regulator [Glaciimonas sp. CA11.2]
MTVVTASHVKHVRSVVQRGMQPDGHMIGDPIVNSWIRCLNEYSLDPDNCDEPVVIGNVELQERQARLADVQQVAKIEMANLYQQLAGSGYAIMLMDCDGVLLNYFGDPSFTHAASKTGLMQGAVWSERLQGTNGMGTCLVEKKPIIVHQNEHYLVRNIGISCAAAPICNHQGDVLAVLDASGESRLAQQHTLALVNMSVQMIENRVFLQQFNKEYIVRFHNRPEFVGTLSEGAIAFDGAGTILAATRCAQFQLGVRSPADIYGRNITELFNVSLSGLLDSSLKKAFHPTPIFEVRSGARYFAVIYPPEPTHGASRMATLKRDACKEASSARCALDELHFGDQVMATNVQATKRVLERDVGVILCGETGTGKEMYAKAAHLSGSRAQQPFVAINCASIPESLIESELFGYKSGAFTGASKDGQRGKIFQANGGTLFLDEIGDMPMSLQARLLRVLEEREVMPLGADKPIKLDIRLISATHCDLQEKIAQNLFREDLYYRLLGLTITLPPLRERTDRHALIKHLLVKEGGGDDNVEIDDALLSVFDHHRWPGNIRQMRHLLRTMIALRESDVLSICDLPAGFYTGPLRVPGCDCDFACDCAMRLEVVRNPLENAERDALIQELEQHNWNITTLAKQLKMSRNTLYRKMRRLDVKDLDKISL